MRFIKRMPIMIITIVTLLSCKTIEINSKKSTITDFTLVNGEPVVDVLINNKILKLYIDTGADSVEIALKPEIIKGIGLKETNEVSKSMDIEGNIYNEKNYKIPEITIAEKKFNNVLVNEEKRNFVEYDGIIGNKLLCKYALYLDYQDKKIGLINQNEIGGYINHDKMTNIKYTKNNAGIILLTNLNGKKFNILFDTGAVVINNENAYGLIRNNEKSNKSLFETSQDDANIVIYKDVEISGYKFEEMGFMKVNLPDQFPADGLIGYNILKDKKIIVNYKNNELYLSRK
jgi:predicted aspartyl protease